MGWFANLLLLIGVYLIGRKDRRAFIFYGSGEAVWTACAIRMDLIDLAVVCAVFSFMAGWNYYRWGAAGSAHDLQLKESMINNMGYYLRCDTLYRDKEDGEGYSLVTLHPFERHHVYGGTRQYAIEQAYKLVFGDKGGCP